MPILILLVFLFLTTPWSWTQQVEDPFDVQLGEKLFKDDRFAQSFFEKNSGDLNKALAVGDPILDWMNTPHGKTAHPLQGQQVSCASCHMVDQAKSEDQSELVFVYNDFEPLSAIPKRSDQQSKTLRNSMNMVISNLHEGRPLHWDGEFFDGQALTCATLEGRNMGWLPQEVQAARAHVVKVIRKDNGTYRSDSDLKGSYKALFAKLGFDIDSMKDSDLRQKVCETIAVYMKSLDFVRDQEGLYSDSGYDRFLKKNGLRRGPKVGENSQQYLQYLRDQINHKQDWEFVGDEKLSYHDHPSRFGKLELQGMKIFFTRGQCVSCHTPPDFTDFNFHNTGISQLEYDAVHGDGAFAKVEFPNWEKRQQHLAQFMTATGDHPQWQGLFAQHPKADKPMATDLGVWNVLGHPDKSSVQKVLRVNLCESSRHPRCDHWSNDDFLDFALGAFKTTTLRSLGQSQPYLHNGSGASLRDVLQTYFEASHQARQGTLVNADPMLKAMHFMPRDFNALEAFLQALDEDYD